MELPEQFGDYYGYGTGRLIPHKPPEHVQFAVDDLLNFSNEDVPMIGDGFTNDATAPVETSISASVSGSESYFSSSSFGSRNFGETGFSAELCVPNDDVAELEWLSNFVEDSFSNAHNLQLQHPTPNPVPETKPAPTITDPVFQPGSAPMPSKSRSRRSRAAPGDWTTRLLRLSPAKPSRLSPDPSGSDESGRPDQVARRCFHCATEKTPQWRTGPMGPKTLCNACGVRYKSGRLVPEYRPAASPTFVSTKHSNSHRKVMELRRQKDVQRVAQVQQQELLCHRANVGDGCLVTHCGGPSYRHMI